MPSNGPLEIQHSMKKHLLIDFITFFFLKTILLLHLQLYALITNLSDVVQEC